MSLLYMTYDHRGFVVAKEEQRNTEEVSMGSFGDLLEHASHDLKKGFCNSFQIFLDNGELIYDSSELSSSIKSNKIQNREELILFLETIIETYSWAIAGMENTYLYTKLNLKIEICKTLLAEIQNEKSERGIA